MSTPARRWAAAVLVPPLALRRDARDFWIATGLTLLGFVPGAAFALYRTAVTPRAT